MNSRRREIDLLTLTAFAAVPLYLTQAVGPVPLVLFHGALAAMIFRVWRGRSVELVPEGVLRAIAMACVPLYFVDAAISHAIAASTHLVLFIAVYQPVESARRDNRAQRLLTASLIFIASIATSTHITIVLFVVAFAFLMFRQMMLLSHLETARSVGHEYDDAPSSRAAGFYLAGTTLLAALLFPVVPRVRNPMVHGLTGALSNATTGLSNSINFDENRSSTPDASVVARVWMGQEAVPFFTPLRLRGTVYERYRNNEWQQWRFGFREMKQFDGAYRIARPAGFTSGARVQQRLIANSTRLFLPAGTYAVSGLPLVAEGPTRDSYVTYQPGRDVLTYEVSIARGIEPLGPRRPGLMGYPVTPPVAALAREIAGGRAAPLDKAAAVEKYLLTNFEYLQRPEQIGHKMTVDAFLLRERRGHCEYFAAGMVALMTALDVPARIVGGFYGGRLNPLTGYFVVRREDAHAWVEVWSGTRWETFDPTPPSMRPGNGQDGLLSTYVTAIGDSVNYFWDRYVLTYGLGDQIALAAELIGRLRDLRAGTRGLYAAIGTGRRFLRGLELLLAAGSLLALIAILARRRSTLFDVLASHLALHGIEVGPATTMEEALDRLHMEQPEHARALEPLIALYREERFSPRRDRKRAGLIRKGLAGLRA